MMGLRRKCSAPAHGGDNLAGLLAAGIHFGAHQIELLKLPEAPLQNEEGGRF